MAGVDRAAKRQRAAFVEFAMAKIGTRVGRGAPARAGGRRCWWCGSAALGKPWRSDEDVRTCLECGEHNNHRAMAVRASDLPG